MEKTVLVTGASAGIGRATAIYLAQNGYKMYGGARRIEKMQDLKEYGIKPISSSAVHHFVKTVFPARVHLLFSKNFATVSLLLFLCAILTAPNIWNTPPPLDLAKRSMGKSL